MNSVRVVGGRVNHEVCPVTDNTKCNMECLRTACVCHLMEPMETVGTD